MQHKFTLALCALFLSLAAAIHAAPLLERREVAELPEARDLLAESDLQERSTLDLSDEEDLVARELDDDLDARDMPDDPLEELTLRGPMRAAQNKKKAEKKKAVKAEARKNPSAAATKKADRETARIAAGRPLPGSGDPTKAPARVAPKDATKPAGPLSKANSLKGGAMNAHIAAQRAAKNDAKNAQRGAGFAGTKKALKAEGRKDNRKYAKLQEQRKRVAAPGSQTKYDGRAWQPKLQGKIVDKNTPSTKKEELARTNRKAANKVAYNALSGPDKAARVTAQNAKVEADKLTAGARRTARGDAKKAATAARKLDSKTQNTQARGEYAKSIATGTFPARAINFNTPQGNHYTGRDARQALFNAHAAGQPGKGVGFDTANGKQAPNKFKHPKEFENRVNTGAGAGSGSVPLPGLAGKGREFGMRSGHPKGYDGRSPNPTETRLITQANGAGVHEFKGVVSHPAGTDNHVQVNGTP